MEFEAKYNVQNTLFSITITEKDMYHIYMLLNKVKHFRWIIIKKNVNCTDCTNKREE